MIYAICPLRAECLPEKTPAKRIWRWEYEALVTAHRTKMQTPEARSMIKQRVALAEHPFGTIKQKLGWSHFLMRGKTKVAGENALIMLTYNLAVLDFIRVFFRQKMSLCV